MLSFPPEFAPLLAPPDLHSFRSILCVQPHPDDIEIGMGGVAASLISAGCRAAFLTVTNGDQGNIDPNSTPEETAAVRRMEVEAGGRHLGASEFIFLNHGDGTLRDVWALSYEIAHVLRTVRPDAVFCPDPWLPYECHLDHIITGKATANAFQLAGRRAIGDMPPTPPHPLPAIGFYFTGKPNAVCDVTDAFERKMEAIAMHKSQVDQQTLELYRVYFGTRGRAMGAPYGYEIGEGVKLLSRLHTHCFAEANDI